MRLGYLLFSVAALLSSCDGNGSGEASDKDDSLLSTALVHNPATAGASDASGRGVPSLRFTDTAHSFGTISEGETVEYSFPFTNTGDAPLLVTGASASCGCTVPDYPREPLAPGKGGAIRVTFNSKGKPGHQEKTVTVTANTAQGQHLLNIAADVTPAAE